MSPTDSEAVTTILADEQTWIESQAVAQLRGTAKLPGMLLAAGLPDLHPGKTGPIGAAFVSRKWIHPQLIGNDAGCGLGLFKTDLPVRRLKLERWQRRLAAAPLERPYPGDCVEWLAAYGLPPGEAGALGTVGGGNHFAELQAVEEVLREDLLSQLGLPRDELLLLIHSGSRGLGQQLLRRSVATQGYKPLEEERPPAEGYLSGQALALQWAVANRALIAARFAAELGAAVAPVLDLPHNFVEPVAGQGGRVWLHRKGASPADRGPLVIPGSRGSFSYLVAPGPDQEQNAWSLPHGAGRKWARGDCRGRLERRFSLPDLERTALGSRVICGDRALLYEEAPQAYKDIAALIRTLINKEKVTVIATLRPLLTYKCGRGGG